MKDNIEDTNETPKTWEELARELAKAIKGTPIISILVTPDQITVKTISQGVFTP